MIRYILIAKEFGELINNFIIACTSTLISLIKIPLLSRWYFKLPRGMNREVIVIGNGPSFSDAFHNHYNFFNEKDIICVNGFPSSDEYIQLKPYMLVWLDVGFYPRNKTDLRPDLAILLDNIVLKTTWKIHILLPQLAKPAKFLKELESLNPLIKIIYFNYTVVDGFELFKNFIYKNRLGMPLCQNVVVAATFLSVSMKYDKVYLTGVENSFFKDITVDHENQIMLNHTHFYDKNLKNAPLKIFKRPDNKQPIDIAGVLMMAVKTFRGYRNVQIFSEYMGVKIYNISTDSYVDAFERRNIENFN